MEKLLKKEWLEELAARKEQVIAYRRHLHQHPELSFQEYETSQFIYDEMSKLENVEVTRPTATSVLVKITGASPARKSACAPTSMPCPSRSSGTNLISSLWWTARCMRADMTATLRF